MKKDSMKDQSSVKRDHTTLSEKKEIDSPLAKPPTMGSEQSYELMNNNYFLWRENNPSSQ